MFYRFFFFVLRNDKRKKLKIVIIITQNSWKIILMNFCILNCVNENNNNNKLSTRLKNYELLFDVFVRII